MGDAFVQVRYHVAIEVVTVFPGPWRGIHILKLCAGISGNLPPGSAGCRHSRKINCRKWCAAAEDVAVLVVAQVAGVVVALFSASGGAPSRFISIFVFFLHPIR